MPTEENIHERREHPVSGARYVLALLALLVLTALTFGLHFASLGRAGLVIALSIASLKVAIVALVFMELLDSIASMRVVAIASVIFLALLCVGIYGDVGFR